MPAADIDSYIAALPEPARAIVAQLRATIHAAVPEVSEAVSYGMPTFRYRGELLLHLAAWKQHVGLYPVSFHTPFEAEIAPYRAAKDTVQLKYKQPVPYELVSRIVVERAKKLDAAT